MNRVILGKKRSNKVTVSSLKGGQLVLWDDYNEKETVYVVVNYKSNQAGLAAISLVDGGFLSPETLVTPLEEGETITVVAG